MQPLAITATSIVTSLGRGRRQTLDALWNGSTGLRPCRFDTIDLPTHVGEVEGVHGWDLQPHLTRFDGRNNRLATLSMEADGLPEAVERAKARYGASRIGVFLGSSTSGILETEFAFRERDRDTGRLPLGFDYSATQSTFSIAEYVTTALGLGGPTLVVSTACSSTTKVFATAARMIAVGLCDAAVVGGSDSLCHTTLHGFNALQLLARGPCRPFDATREGLSIGEAAGFALVERADAGASGAIHILGIGESSDAHHMSAPHPEGAGAIVSMQGALRSAGLRPDEIDYVNLHGTATPIGDAAEDLAVMSVFGDRVPCSSTKGHTGHTLGASGIVEAIFSMLAISESFIPGSPHTEARDPALRCNYVTAPREARVDRVLSNSFGFGGSNATLVLGRAA